MTAMKRPITSLTLFLLLLAGAGCVGTAKIDLTGEEQSTIVTSLRGSFRLPDGSPAAGARVTARYGEQFLITEANGQGRFSFPRWNILAHPGTVEAELTDGSGHLWFGSMGFGSLGDGDSSAFVGKGELQHTTTLTGRVVRPDWILDPPWCEIEGGGMTAKFTTDHQGYFRVERWPSDAQPIELCASAGERPDVWAKGSSEPMEFSREAAEFDLGEIEVEELPVIPSRRSGLVGGGE